MPGCGAARLVVSALSLKRPRLFPQEGLVAEWLRRGLQILAPRFDSGRGLQIHTPRNPTPFPADDAGQLSRAPTRRSACAVVLHNLCLGPPQKQALALQPPYSLR